MMLAILLLAAQAPRVAPRAERTEQASLLQAFRSFCLTEAAKAGALAAPAAAAGFKPTPLTATDLGWDETAAWRRRGMRLFSMTAPTDTQLRPMCGITAEIGRLDDDYPLVESVIALTGTVFGEGHRARGISGWMLAQRRGSVRVEIDYTNAANVRVTLIAYPRLH